MFQQLCESLKHIFDLPLQKGIFLNDPAKFTPVFISDEKAEKSNY